VKLWFTASELADLELPGLPDSKRGIAKMAMRENWTSRTSLCRIRAGLGGGFEYHIDILPAEIRALYVARTVGGVSVPLQLARDAAQEPAAQDLTASGLEGRDARLALLAACDAYIRDAKLNQHIGDRAFCALYNVGAIDAPEWVRGQIKEMSPRTLARWRANAKAGETARLAVDRGAARRGRGLLDVAEDGAVKTFILAAITKQPHLTAHHISTIVADKFPALGFVPVRTVQKTLQAWKVSHRAEIMALTNPDKFKSSYRTAGRGSHPVSRLNQLWMIDASPADMLCVDGRYAVYVAVDIFSRRVQVYVSRTARADAVCLLMRRAIMTWGVPELVKTDNGSDFVAKTTQRLFAALAIETEKATPFSPEQKGHVERAIGTLQRDFMPLLPGFIGHSVADRKIIEARKSFAARLGEDPKNAFCVELTAAELQAYADRWADERYAMRPHDGLQGQTPFAMAASYAGTVRKIADPRALDMLLAPVAGKDGLRVVTKSGVRVDGSYYLCPEIMPETQVLVRMDPLDAGRAYLFEPEGARFLGEAICPDLAGIDPAQLVMQAKAKQKAILDAGTAEIKKVQRSIKPRDMVDAVLRQSAKASGKLVELPRRSETHETPQIAAALEAFTLEPTDFVNQLDAAAQQQMQAIEAELAKQNSHAVPAQSAPVAVLHPSETPQIRFRRALDIEQRIGLRQPVTVDEAQWLGGYRQGSEYRSLRAVFDDFGEAALR